MTTTALVESPAQLLNVLEWAHAQGTDDLCITVLAPRQEQSRQQLHRMSELAGAVGHRLDWQEPRASRSAGLASVRALSGQLRATDQLVLGDPFSGLMQLVLGLSRIQQLVVVDDGSATLEFVERLESGGDLVRWHRAGRSRPLAALARRRLTARPGRSVQLFTAMPVESSAVTVVRNSFGWSRRRYPAPVLLETTDLVGTSLVETGVVELDRYLRGVELLAGRHGVSRYLAHRRESAAKLSRIEALGLDIVRPDLPLELWVRRSPIGRTVLSFPSTVVHTLPVVLRGLGVSVSCCDIDNDWFTHQASPHSQRFLTTVTRTARLTYGLSSVAAA
ncbi:hypothetical protein GCM10009841_24160 [Microlunatus panaciterrae]|uniref:Uncharacterized protein n=1 Tax=Microlunatus panaciterrae TaxID=400768 RepID=A0ABS2REC2_9ACTN|nr:hypothetical protein [Microlunatus panaciterrae]MBM7797297.1 hypothetical protein [Microlunatus panaciterrae]